MSEWISVRERRPTDGDYPIAVARFDEDGDWEYVNAGFIDEFSTYYHWMPLPPPPGEKGKE